MVWMADSPLAPHASTAAELQERLHAEREGDPFLVFRDDQGRQRLEQLEGRAGPVTIGRNPSNDVALTWDEEVSRLHAEVERLGGEWILADEGISRNGSFVNGERVDGRRRLRDGDVIRIGKTTLAFRIPEPADSRPTAAATGHAGPPQLTDTQRRIVTALVRPYRDSDFAAPATNGQIADEVFLSVDAVKAHLRGLFQAFGVDALPQNQKRAALAMRVLQEGVVSRRDL
jgi:pSer/pThr/pTyr-binding forkhead associated (FHA) protein